MNPYTPPAGPFSDEELNAYIETMMLFAVADGTVKNLSLIHI